MSDRTYYVICADGCKFESMTKEQILSAIEQAVRTGEIKDVDAGFVTKIREKNKNIGLSFWVGTSADYNALTEKDNNCFYILTDDTFGADIAALIEDMSKNIEQCEKDITTNKNNISVLNQQTTNLATDLNNTREWTQQLNNTVYTLDVDVGELKNDKNKKNKTLWSGNLAFNTWVSSTENISNINDYDIVKVRVPLENNGTTDVLVLCTVCKLGTSSLVITGSAPTNNDISGTVQQANVYIKCSTVGKITMQETKILHITADTQTIYERAITEIIGVM